MKRCDWCLGNELMTEYHDREWGVPVRDDRKLFEYIILDTFQAGLSWSIILKKREEFRKAFDNFDYDIISNYNDRKIMELMENSGIIRNKLKISAAIVNARAYRTIRKEYGTFTDYLWSFVNNKPIVNRWQSILEIPAKTELSDFISKSLSKNGFKFVGSTIVYAFIQAAGIVNDHLVDCFRYNEILNLND